MKVNVFLASPEAHGCIEVPGFQDYLAMVKINFSDEYDRKAYLESLNGCVKVLKTSAEVGYVSEFVEAVEVANHSPEELSCIYDWQSEAYLIAAQRPLMETEKTLSDLCLELFADEKLDEKKRKIIQLRQKEREIRKSYLAKAREANTAMQKHCETIADKKYAQLKAERIAYLGNHFEKQVEFESLYAKNSYSAALKLVMEQYESRKFEFVSDVDILTSNMLALLGLLPSHAYQELTQFAEKISHLVESVHNFSCRPATTSRFIMFFLAHLHRELSSKKEALFEPSPDNVADARVTLAGKPGVAMAWQDHARHEQERERVKREQALAEAKSNAVKAIATAEKAIQTGDFNDALKEADQACAYDPTNMSAYYCRSRLHGLSGSLDKALADMALVVKQDESETNLAWLGELLLEKLRCDEVSAEACEGYRREATRVFSKLLTLNPKLSVDAFQKAQSLLPGLYWDLYSILFHEGGHSDQVLHAFSQRHLHVVDVLKQVCDLNPSARNRANLTVVTMRYFQELCGEGYSHQLPTASSGCNLVAEAETIRSMTQLAPDMSRYQLEIARGYLQHHHAIEQEKQKKILWDHLRGKYRLRCAQHHAMEAIRMKLHNIGAFDTLAEVFMIMDKPDKVTSIQHLQTAVKECEQGHFSGMATELDKAMRADPDNDIAAYNAAMYDKDIRVRTLDKKISQFERRAIAEKEVTERDGLIAEKKLILAQCEAKLILAITANQRDKAVTLLKDNLDESTEFEHVPKEPEYVLQLAEVQLAQRKTAEASASYQEAIALDSSNSYAQQKLAELQLFIDSSSAKATFQQAQALDQSNRHAKLGLIACQLKELGLLQEEKRIFKKISPPDAIKNALCELITSGQDAVLKTNALAMLALVHLANGNVSAANAAQQHANDIANHEDFFQGNLLTVVQKQFTQALKHDVSMRTYKKSQSDLADALEIPFADTKTNIANLQAAIAARPYLSGKEIEAWYNTFRRIVRWHQNDKPRDYLAKFISSYILADMEYLEIYGSKDHAIKSLAHWYSQGKGRIGSSVEGEQLEGKWFKYESANEQDIAANRIQGLFEALLDFDEGLVIDPDLDKLEPAKIRKGIFCELAAIVEIFQTARILDKLKDLIMLIPQAEQAAMWAGPLRELIEIHAEKIIKMVVGLESGEEYVYPSGIFGCHSIYFTLHIDPSKDILPRIDNRGYGYSGNEDLGVKREERVHEYTKKYKPSGQEVCMVHPFLFEAVKPQLWLTDPKYKRFFYELTVASVKPWLFRCSLPKSEREEIHFNEDYSRALNESLNLIYNEWTHIFKPHPNRTYFPAQQSQIVGNCVLKSMTVGSRIRLSGIMGDYNNKSLYRFIKYSERASAKRHVKSLFDNRSALFKMVSAHEEQKGIKHKHLEGDAAQHDRNSGGKLPAPR